jgi:hypothetical protein
MDLNTILSSGPSYALIGVLLTVIVNYLIQSRKSKSDLSIVERQTLSEDQEKFKQSILQELGDCRSAIDKLTVDNQTWREKAISVQEQKLALTEEIIRLNQKVLQMDGVIKELQATIDEMKRG